MEASNAAGGRDALQSPHTAATPRYVGKSVLLADINPDTCQTRSFTHIKADAYYTPLVEWEGHKNIVTETGDKLFSPDAGADGVIRQG